MTTEAGRRLLAGVIELATEYHLTGRTHGWDAHGVETCTAAFTDAIATIEAEAVAAYKARLRERWDAAFEHDHHYIARDQVLALLDEEDPK